MAEYIEREAVIHKMKMDIRPPFAVVRDFPAADVVPVVRCKDCKFWDFGDCYRLELSRTDDFCSYGERKEGAD